MDDKTGEELLLLLGAKTYQESKLTQVVQNQRQEIEALKKQVAGLTEIPAYKE